MFMNKQFEMERFNHIKATRVQIADYRFGHNQCGELNVWIESGDNSERFMWQVVVAGDSYLVNTGISTKHCHILLEKLTGRYFFLDINDSGIWLFNESFFGAETFHITETARIQKWLATAH